MPVFGVSFLAAVEYGDWLTRRQGDRPRWRFRLPRDTEWEKAARGADRRVHVWGDYLVRSFCKCLNSSPGDRGIVTPWEPGGIFPFDESPYGIRDMAGSVCEPVLGIEPRLKWCIYRGGYWQATDVRDFRAATPLRHPVKYSARDVGIRLAAEPFAPPKM